MQYAIKSCRIDPVKIAALRTESLRTDPGAFGEILETAEGRDSEEWEKWLAERNNGADRSIMVAESEGRYVGMTGVGLDRFSKGRGFLWGVYVLPTCRGHGIALELLGTAHKWLASKGVGWVTAEVSGTNEGVFEFYHKAGYKVTGESGSARNEGKVPLYKIELKFNPAGVSNLAKLQIKDPLPQKEICHCGNQTPVHLRYAFSEFPVYCCECTNQVLPKAFQIGEGLAWDILSWRKVYAALYDLWLDSGAYEDFAGNALQDINGQVNVEGRRVAELLETRGGGRKVYYWYFHEFEEIILDCPFCDGDLKPHATRSFSYCDSCRISM